MRILMLGTGAADGWPSPFCVCASCTSQREAGIIRGQTSALVDDRILLDCGAESARAAQRAGVALDQVEIILLTHAHPDHCNPQAALWRSWTGPRSPLVVAGPADAIDLWRPWIGPDDEVELLPLLTGDTVRIDGYAIEAVSATHSPGALLYRVIDAQGCSLLYATDTGPLADDAWAALGEEALDALLLELTWGEVTDHGTDHHDLDSFARTLAAMRRRSVIGPTTVVRALHLGHRNPPEVELQRRLHGLGAAALSDLEVLTIGGAPAAEASRTRRTLILGGARSGKSTQAERLVAADAHVTYVATAPVSIDDAEWTERIAQHQSRRPAEWHTLETTDLAGVLAAAPRGSTILIDCLTLWLSSVMDAHRAWEQDADPATLLAPRLTEVLDALRTTHARVVLVSNEVGSGVVPATPSGRRFRDALGAVNAAVARECEDVLLVTAGRVQRL